MKWTDINDLAVELAEAHPEVDPMKINFVDLMHWVWPCPASKTMRGIVAKRSSRRSSKPGSTNWHETRRYWRQPAQRTRWPARLVQRETDDRLFS
jgi:hypothetical protein